MNITVGPELISQLDNKLKELHEDLVHFRKLETQVRTAQKATDELSYNLDDLEKFAAGTGDCSIELVRNFISTNYDYPKVNFKVSVEKGVQTENPVSVAVDKTGLQFAFLKLKKTLKNFYKKYWSVPLSLDGVFFHVGVMKMMCHHEHVPKLQISFQTYWSKPEAEKADLRVKISVLNNWTRYPIFEKHIWGHSACNVHHVRWTIIEDKESGWLDSEGSLTVNCAKL